MKKGLGWILAVVGVVLVAAGLVMALAVVPGMKKMPADTDVTRTYEGTMPVMLNPQTFEFVRDVPIELKRHFKVVETDGDLALVKEERTMTSGGQPLEQMVCDYSINRSTMMWGTGYPEAWKSSEGFWDREGIVLSWPIDSQKHDYTGWSDDYRSTVPLEFANETKHARSGMTLYTYISASVARPIAPEEVAALGLPATLPKKQLESMIAQAQVSPMVVAMIPKLLANVPGDTVPLKYFYEYQGTYWVDPATGILVDTEKHELRKVGFADEALAGTPLENMTDEQKAGLAVTISDYTYKATDQSVKEAADDAKSKGRALTLYGTYLPWGGVIVGVVLLVLGLVFVVVGPKRAAAPEPPSECGDGGGGGGAAAPLPRPQAPCQARQSGARGKGQCGDLNRGQSSVSSRSSPSLAAG